MEEFDAFYIICLLLFFLLGFLLIKKNSIETHFELPAFFKVISWNILLSLFLVFFVFLVGESYYRFLVDTTDSFAINKISQRWLKRHSTLNNFEMRDNIEYSNKVAKGKRRLTIIGDSFTSGHGIKNVENRFANILRKKYPDIEVHLLAHPGSNSYSQLKNLQRLEDINYQYDIVLLAYCLNDIDYYVKETGTIYQRIHAFNSQLNYIERNSYFINTLTFRFFASKDPNFMNYSDFVMKGYSGSTWELQKETLRNIKKQIQNKRGKLAVLTFPFLQQSDKEYNFRQVHNRLGDFWEEEGVPHLDLTTIYEPYLGTSLSVNQFDAHPNEFAHQLAAEAIEIYLMDKSPNPH